jgi:hypothetical protein
VIAKFLEVSKLANQGSISDSPSVEITQGVFTQAVNHFNLDVCLVSSSLLIEGSVEYNECVHHKAISQ